MSDDLVWRTARARVLAAFDRQYAKGVATYGVPLQPTVDGLDLAEEALSELVDAAVYLQAVAVERDSLRAEVARLREVAASDTDLISRQITAIDNGAQEIARLREALEDIRREVGTSTRAWHLANRGLTGEHCAALGTGGE